MSSDGNCGSLVLSPFRPNTVVNKKALLDHIEARLKFPARFDSADDQPEWLSSPSESDCNLRDFGVSPEGDAFDFDSWRSERNAAFNNRTPDDVIDQGPDTDRMRLAAIVDAIAAYQDGAFS